jgi:hypothetical protein
MKNENLNFLVLPEEKWEELLTKVDTIATSLGNNKTKLNPIGDYITEKEAKELLGRGTTWFWNKRKSKELNGRKSGNVWYYSVREIQKFIENGVRN